MTGIPPGRRNAHGVRRRWYYRGRFRTRKGVGPPAREDLRGGVGDLVENERLHREHREENRRIGRMLEEKGFGIGGDEPGAVQINRWLRMGGADGG